jgi:hypothetical protein
MKKTWVWLILLITAICIILSAYWLIQGEIHYDIDISRDFLVISEAVSTHRPFLIGPHSGVVAGVFHGPLWYYLNVPAFILGHGNPVLTGWFWFGLSIVTIVIVGWVAKKLFNLKVALLSMLLYSANSIINPMDSLKQFFNPYGAVMFFPLFYYYFLEYLKKKRVRDLIIVVFINGLLIQFQMAFGAPILLATLAYLMFFIFKNKLYKHLLAILVLTIPLSTFFLFDLRHDWLQTRSLVTYLLSAKPKNIDLLSFIIGRVRAIFSDLYAMLVPGSKIMTWFISGVSFLVVVFNKLYRRQEFGLYLYLYFSFWIILFLFKGWTGNYYWPFLPILIILLSSLVNYLPKKIFLMIYIFLFVWNFGHGIKQISSFPQDITRRGINSWQYNRLLADNIYENAGAADFGYFIFTPDRWVYNQRYALEFEQLRYPKVISHSSTKLPVTFLIVVDPPNNRPDIDPVGWRISDIGITKEAVSTRKIDVATIYRYELSNREVQIPHNPNLLDSTFFR